MAGNLQSCDKGKAKMSVLPQIAIFSINVWILITIITSTIYLCCILNIVREETESCVLEYLLLPTTVSKTELKGIWVRICSNEQQVFAVYPFSVEHRRFYLIIYGQHSFSDEERYDSLTSTGLLNMSSYFLEIKKIFNL